MKLTCRFGDLIGTWTGNSLACCLLLETVACVRTYGAFSPPTVKISKTIFHEHNLPLKSYRLTPPWFCLGHLPNSGFYGIRALYHHTV